MKVHYKIKLLTVALAVLLNSQTSFASVELEKESLDDTPQPQKTAVPLPTAEDKPRTTAAPATTEGDPQTTAAPASTEADTALAKVLQAENNERDLEQEQDEAMAQRQQAEEDAEVERLVVEARKAAERKKRIDARVQAILAADEQQQTVEKQPPEAKKDEEDTEVERLVTEAREKKKTERQRLQAATQKAADDAKKVGQNIGERPAKEVKRFAKKMFGW